VKSPGLPEQGRRLDRNGTSSVSMSEGIYSVREMSSSLGKGGTKRKLLNLENRRKEAWS
jgi:hypothetical protein